MDAIKVKLKHGHLFLMPKSTEDDKPSVRVLKFDSLPIVYLPQNTEHKSPFFTDFQQFLFFSF